MKINYICQEWQLENNLDNNYHAKNHIVMMAGQWRPDETSETYTSTLEGELFLAKHLFFKSRSVKKSLYWWMISLYACSCMLDCFVFVSMWFHPKLLGQSCWLTCSAIAGGLGPVLWLGFTTILPATIDEHLQCHPLRAFIAYFALALISTYVGNLFFT